jgi:chemotaxis protein MotB
MKLNFYSLLSIFIISFLLESCVPARQFEETKTARDQCKTELAELKSRYETFTAKEKELNVRIDDLSKQVKNLEGDTLRTGISLRRLISSYDKLNSTYDQLLDKNADLLRGKDADNIKLMGQYQMTQEELQRKEDRLKTAEESIEKKKNELEILSQNLKEAEEALAIKQAKVTELENILAQKDSIVKNLREKVSNALISFQDNGLTIDIKNGKVYVSLEERLLFESGKTDVDAKGVEAIKNLSKVLEREAEITILIEGHTDNVPIKSATIKDNWDLSVLRATAIVRIIMSNSKIDPRRLTAAGKGEFFPVDKANTAEARRKNRRTEIILTPKLDELFQILDSN